MTQRSNRREYLRGMAALRQARRLDDEQALQKKVGEFRFFRDRSVLLAPGMTGWLPASLGSWESDPYRDDVAARHGNSEAAVMELGTWLYSLHESEFPRKPYAPTNSFRVDWQERAGVYESHSLDYAVTNADRGLRPPRLPPRPPARQPGETRCGGPR